jgi:hypothetical protein
MILEKIPEIEALSTYEKMLLISEIWEIIKEDEADLSIPPGHKLKLEERLKRYRLQPNNVLTLQELQRRIERRKRT